MIGLPTPCRATVADVRGYSARTLHGYNWPRVLTFRGTTLRLTLPALFGTAACLLIQLDWDTYSSALLLPLPTWLFTCTYPVLPVYPGPVPTELPPRFSALHAVRLRWFRILR